MAEKPDKYRGELVANQWTECRVLDGGVGEGTEGAEWICSPMEGATVSTGQTPGAPRTGPPLRVYTWRTTQSVHMEGPPRVYTWRDPGLRLHVWQRMALLDISGRSGPWA